MGAFRRRNTPFHAHAHARARVPTHTHMRTLPFTDLLQYLCQSTSQNPRPLTSAQVHHSCHRLHSAMKLQALHVRPTGHEAPCVLAYSLEDMPFALQRCEARVVCGKWQSTLHCPPPPPFLAHTKIPVRAWGGDYPFCLGCFGVGTQDLADTSPTRRSTALHRNGRGQE